MSENVEPHDSIESLAEEFIAHLRGGEHVSVSQYAAAHPQHAEQIRELFPTIAAMERVKLSDAHMASLGDVRLERLGDFRIIREIGRGGMGIVYEAEQESLGRRVAVKVLPPRGTAEAIPASRFTREARLAARLHHTNIVPIFGVGQQDEFHYYVMQLIRGVGLDRIINALAKHAHGGKADDGSSKAKGIVNAAEAASTEQQVLSRVLKDLAGRSGDSQSEPALVSETAVVIAAGARIIGPRYWKWVARIGLQVADALHYAHAQGTLHRDIKPGNVLVDLAGTAWVTDFGLARALRSDGATKDEVSGTPRYMAPEQFDGQADARSDLYGLGLMLYELLTLRPAFAQSDRTTLIHSIRQGQCQRPCTVNKHLPRDLEAIVLKAIDPDPARRYSSAGAMADDLRRFLEARPITARRSSPPQRLWRWCQRSPAVASLTLATLLLAITVAIVVSIGYATTQGALKSEEHQRARSDRTAALAQEALDHIFDRLGSGPLLSPSQFTLQGSDGASITLPSQPTLSRQSAALLEEMLPFYDRLAAQSEDDAQLRLRAAEANMRIGDIRQRLGQYDQSVAAYRRAADIFEQLRTGSTGADEHLVRLAEIHNEIGRVCSARRQSAEARQAHEKTLALVGSADSAAARFESARAHYFLGAWSMPEPGANPTQGERGRDPRGRFGPPDERDRGPGGRFGPPDERGPRGFGGRRDDDPPPGPPSERGFRPPPPPPTDQPVHQPPPSPAQAPGDVADTAGRIEHLAQAIAILDDLSARSTVVSQYRRLLAMAHRDHAELLRPRDPFQSEQESKQAIQIFEQLAERFPQSPDYRFDACEAYAMVDVRSLEPDSEQLPACESRLRKALAVSLRLTGEFPQVPDYQISQAHIYHRLGEVLRKMRRPAEGEKCDRQAVDIQAALADQFPEVLALKIWLAAFRDSLADLLVQRDRPAEAKALAEGTIDLLNNLLATQPGVTFVHTLLADNYHVLSAALSREGEMDGASRYEQMAEDERRKGQYPREATGGPSTRR